MFLQEMQYTVDKINASTINYEPYTWIEVENIFSEKIYANIIKNKIPSEFLHSLKETGRVNTAYSDGRLITEVKPCMPSLPEDLREFWEDLGIWLNYSFKKILFQKFNLSFTNIKIDCLYTRDSKGFYLRPHVDTNSKIVTALIYLPENKNSLAAGTSIYVPKKENFVCERGVHHRFDDFYKWKTITYEPNKLFCFLKSNKSFHGLEPVKEDGDRDLLIFDVQKA